MPAKVPPSANGGATAATNIVTAPRAKPIVLIPAYKPEPILPELVATLLNDDSVAAIIVVNDGSGAGYDEIFDAISALDGVVVLRHAVNLGKGAALQTGLNYAACYLSEHAGVVTADADGQHTAPDIISTARALMTPPVSLILGARQFTGSVPARSKFGNTVTRCILRAITGQNLSDTQTGLRGIPMSFVPKLLSSKQTGYDFELDMIVACQPNGWKVREIPIQTIYLGGNRSSHFNPLLDSMRIYFVLLRYTAVSMLTAVIDNLVFILAFHFLGTIGRSQIVARLIACAFNYSANKTGVFRSPERNAMALPKYVLSAVLAGFLTYLMIQQVVAHLHLSVITAKIGVESLMFLFSFVLQRDFVFSKGIKDDD